MGTVVWFKYLSILVVQVSRSKSLPTKVHEFTMVVLGRKGVRGDSESRRKETQSE